MFGFGDFVVLFGGGLTLLLICCLGFTFVSFGLCLVFVLLFCYLFGLLSKGCYVF